MPTSSVTSNEDDYYTILNLSRPRSVSSYSVSKDELKAAYHRTLLLHHPDKINKSTVKSSLTENKLSAHRNVYSVDQIMRAYQILADPVQRAAYDQTLLGNPSRIFSESSYTGSHLGVETFDLEELEYHEENETWSRVCRCGNEEGYVLTEAELEKESSEGELYVGCKGCSLFIRVLFGVEEENAQD